MLHHIKIIYLFEFLNIKYIDLCKFQIYNFLKKINNNYLGEVLYLLQKNKYVLYLLQNMSNYTLKIFLYKLVFIKSYIIYFTSILV